jgi:linoleoyl-CoA desaturase
MQRVEAFFKQNDLKKTANLEMIFKTVLILSGWVATFTLIMMDFLPGWAMFLLAMGHGFFCALIGLNIGHDAIHGSYSNKSWINKALGLGFNIVGANDYTWSISHNIVHHTYTNIPHHDEDINQPSILRIEPTQELWKIHKYQKFYAWPLYSFATLSWVFIKDYVKFFQKQLGGHYRKTIPQKEVIRLFTYKVFYYAVFVVAPYLVLDAPWYFILLGFVAAHLVEGFTLAIIFMLAHIVEGVEYPEPNESGQIEMAWAEMQMRTTSNFANKSRVVNYLFGGLNFQVEHHLFPKVCHVHYPKISKIVRETAHDHNIPYLEHETFFGAIRSHARVLIHYGNNVS